MRIVKTRWTTRAVIAAMVVYALCGIVRTQLHLHQAEAYRLALEAEAARLTEENRELEAAIQSVDDPAVMEQLARTRLGLVRPGEIIFYAEEETALERE